MNPANRVIQPTKHLKPDAVDQFFSLEKQRTYISMLLGRGGLTRRRAEYFVRLWAYLLLKQQYEQGENALQPLTHLHPLEAPVACTHREAAELFYQQQERGSDRAAGMMIDRLVALGLLEKRFDGQTLCLQIYPVPEIAIPLVKQTEPIKLLPDQFNPRTDAIPSANLITRTYAEIFKDLGLASQKITKALRVWGQQYPKGLRVLRRSDNLNPVAISVLYPVASEAESNFFQPPSKSFFLSSENEVDPFTIAMPGDLTCTSVYIRAWILDSAHQKGENLYMLLQDTKETLIQMQQDFPNLCDLYSPIVHPLYEELRLALGFQKTFQDTQRSYHWGYLAIDRFLAIDIKQVLASLKANSSNSKPV